MPTTSAWASVAAFVAATAFEITLTVCPWPSAPTCRIISPIASKYGRARSKSACAPPAMIVSVPSSAFGEEPETGASTKRHAALGERGADPLASAGAIVVQSMNSVPSAAPPAAPSSPSRIASTCGPSTTIVITAAAPSAASRGDAATRPPCSSANACAFSAVRL